jgi:hypothetical protein
MKDGTTSTTNWADFPALGVDNKALYITSNQFAFGGNFQYAKIRVIPKVAGPSNSASIQWCEINPVGPSVVQQGVYGARGSHYFFPALCPDNNGSAVMVFSRSGSTEFGSIYYTGRRSTDAPGTLQVSALPKAGTAHYVGLDSGGRNRWGDYNGVAADPANSRLIWFCSEYASAPNSWATWLGSAFF